MTGIGERINARRKELGMTQEELSKKLGYKNKSTISQIENGVNDIMQSKVACASSIRCLYQIAFSGRLLPKQKPEQHKDSTLTMLQHIEDPEAWEKIYKLVNVLWLKEATYRTVELEKGVKKA